jgi:hypothetical protein
MDNERMLTLRVREPARRATRFVFEDGKPVHYQGGEVATVEQGRALEMLATGNFDCLDELTDQEARFLAAKMDRTWPARNGHYPKFDEFK